jgi:hypothetical protein
VSYTSIFSCFDRVVLYTKMRHVVFNYTNKKNSASLLDKKYVNLLREIVSVFVGVIRRTDCVGRMQNRMLQLVIHTVNVVL